MSKSPASPAGAIDERCVKLEPLAVAPGRPILHLAVHLDVAAVGQAVEGAGSQRQLVARLEPARHPLDRALEHACDAPEHLGLLEVTVDHRNPATWLEMEVEAEHGGVGGVGAQSETLPTGGERELGL
jgi:hypothetical protein